jgi:hypothetical protein
MHTEIGRIYLVKQNVFKSIWCMKSSASVFFVCSDKSPVSMLAERMFAGVLLPSILANGCALNSGVVLYDVATSLFHRM